MPTQLLSRFLVRVLAQGWPIHLLAPRPQGPTAKCFQCHGFPVPVLLWSPQRGDMERTRGAGRASSIRPADEMGKSCKLLSTDVPHLKPGSTGNGRSNFNLI